MRRREFMVGFGGAAVLPRLTLAQRKSTKYAIGFLAANRRPDRAHAFVMSIEELGYIEGRDFSIEWRFADWDVESLPRLAADLVSLKVDLIVATSNVAVIAAQNATNEIPIVMGVSYDPVRMGLVPSLSRPGANTTGVTSNNDETTIKQIEFLSQMVPNLMRVGYLSNVGVEIPTDPGLLANIRTQADRIRISVHQIGVRHPKEFSDAFSRMNTEGVQAIVVASNYLLNRNSFEVAKLALSHRLPSISQRREYCEDGGLMSYGEQGEQFFQRIAYFVDKIIKGAKPADLPVEAPTRFEFVINRKTAVALGLSIPFQLHTLADAVLDDIPENAK